MLILTLKRLLGPACLALTFTLAGPALAADARPPAPPFELAVTVDDLTVHGPLPRTLRWRDVAAVHLAAFRAHGVLQAWGFVNGRRLLEQPDSAAVLAAWRQAGHPLGNHTYSHLGLSAAPTLQAWIADASAGEAALAAPMAGADWHMLRFPFLDAGSDPVRHAGAAAWLQAQGYRVAEVSLSFDDWAYGEPYARCMEQGDAPAIAAMQRAYLERVDAILVRSAALSQRVYGRMIPQVLLTHMGPWGAATLPAVLARLDAAGARYVSLEQAQSDAAYRAPGLRPGQGMLMERRAQENSIDLTGLPPAPPLPRLDLVCRR